MKCIIVDDEPLAREAIELLIKEVSGLKLEGSFSNALAAGKFMLENPVDLVFLDIRMPGIDGIEFAKTISNHTLVIFTTAFSEYAIESYEVDAIDYLVKPIESERFRMAVEKAMAYQFLLSSQKNSIENITGECIFVKAERRYFKVLFNDIFFIEGLKDYVVIQTIEQRIITKMNLKTIHEQLPQTLFLRVNKSYIINAQYIDSFDNNDIFIKNYIVPIGVAYRESFFEKILGKKG